MKTISIFALWVLILTNQQVQAQSMSISYPLEKTVFQRCEYGGSRASFYVAGQCLLANQQYSLQIKITELYATNGSYKSVYQDWTTFANTRPYGGLYKYNVQLPGGWYKIEIQALVNNAQYAWASVKVGVGEVFMIAGQSNAQGVTSVPIYSQQGYDGVVADLYTDDCSIELPRFPSLMTMNTGYPIATQGPTIWCYTVLGNKIVDQTGVPVSFFNAARFGTTVGNWQTSANGQQTNNVYPPGNPICNRTSAPYQPYTAFKNILNWYGSFYGTRGVLWHQGEADNQQSTTTTDYQNRLNDVISKSRSDFGQSSLGWYIAKATYNPEVLAFGRPATWPDVINAQTSVSSSNRSGPSTDNVGIPRNGNNNEVHFGGSQLYDLGNVWYNSSLTNGTPICANSMPDLQVTKNSDGTYELTGEPSGSYVNWYWVKGDNKPDGGNIISSGRIFSNVPSTSESYRYYAVTSNGNYVVSQKIYLPLPAGSARMGVAEEFTEENYGYSLKVSPNPASNQVSISFKLPQEMPVRVEIVNEQGALLKVVTDAHHASGLFTYPVNVAQLPTGIYFCRLKAGDLFLVKKIVKVQ